MATNTIFFTPDNDIEEELKAEITEIFTASVDKPVITADLDDNQKRWLIIGICLQNILSPTLRNFTEPVVLNLYNYMKISHNIDTQTYPNQLQQYPKGRTRLNYEVINNNRTKPRVHKKPDVANFDYKVGNHVQFSKLFMKTFMAQYSAFDDTCDLSALLSLISSIDTFPQPVKKVAMQLRSDVRNPWAHCNFNEWDTISYQRSFQVLHQLIKCLNIPDETAILSELTKWETNGFFFLQGYAVDQHVVREIRKQTQVLAEYALKMSSGEDKTFEKVHEAMLKINGEIVSVCKRIDNIETNQQKQHTALKETNNDVNMLYERTSKIENVQIKQDKDIGRVITDIQEITRGVENLESKSTSTKHKLDELADEIKQTTEDVEIIKSDITEMKIDIDDFKIYMSKSKPIGKIFFYPPNRSEYFVAREKEMSYIKSSFGGKGNKNHTLVISGLGGCGKTTLATEFAWRSQEFYDGGVFWMSAESESSLEDSINTLAIDVNTSGKDFRETFKKTLNWFSNLTQRWLLVVDNADEEHLSDYTKELLNGSWKRNTIGHIIITTRRESNEIEESMMIKPEYCILLTIF
ncbi:unnamed protein product [Mytilus edulis]|uniref:NB-ARC domain-containing protein n=1 Tax=Mytilus edulis TaxID=6550 RepID=A0A8S3QWS5_MYTED|nr:unnamed protein product [Mytilus edulis]